MRRNRAFWIVLALSAFLACLSFLAPARRMPLDYSAITSRSLPTALVWSMLMVAAVVLFRTRGLWLLVGGPIAFYWPLWLLVHGYPPCWYLSNCV
jgi:hypothetical protein